MSETNWAPEPWYIQPHPWPPSIRRGKEGDEIARAQSPYTNPEYRDEERANGDRIVACVNACAGIPDPASEIERLRRVEVAAREALWWTINPSMSERDRVDGARAVLESALKEPANG